MPTLRDVGEIEAIRLLHQAVLGRADVVVGPGDDAAVLRCDASEDLVATTDALVEGRHYLPLWLNPAARGARLAAVNLSDLAAMAARPRWALLSIGARPEHEMDALVEFQRGLETALATEGATIAGGNLVAVDGEEWWSLTLLGSVARGRAWTRAGARPGDLLALTGHPGRAAAGLALARRAGAPDAVDPKWRPLLEAWLEPRARTAFAQALAPAEAVTAAIDVSDGLAADLAHLCVAGGVGARVEEAALPVDPPLAAAVRAITGLAGQERGPLPAGEGALITRLQLGASDDYELLFALEPAQWEECARVAAQTGTPVARIGAVTDGDALVLASRGGGEGPLDAPGWDHFRDRG